MYHFLQGVLSKQRIFIPDVLLLDKTLTSGALHNTWLTWFTFVWPHGQNFGLSLDLLTTTLRPKFWPHWA